MHRKLGLELLDPSLRDWVFLTDDGIDEGTADCWVCGGHSLCVFFWSQSLGEKQTRKISKPEQDYYNEGPAFKLAKSVESDKPLLQGPFNNWQP